MAAAATLKQNTDMSTSPDLHTLFSEIDAQLSAVAGDAPGTTLPRAVDKEEIHKFVLVGIGELRLAIAVEGLAEIGPLPTITYLPNLPEWIHGIINLRSEVVSVVDLPGFLGVRSTASLEGRRIVVVRDKRRKVGLRANRIIGTVAIPVSQMEAASEAASTSLGGQLFSARVRQDDVDFAVLDVAKFLTLPRLVDYNRFGY